MRYWVIVVKKREKVDGDEQAIIGALLAVIVTYPLWAFLIYYFTTRHLLTFFTNLAKSFGVSGPGFVTQNFSTLFSAFYILFTICLMARLWRFSLKHLRELRHKIIDIMDFIIGDYS